MYYGGGGGGGGNNSFVRQSSKLNSKQYRS
jgi:hypothetical protein